MGPAKAAFSLTEALSDGQSVQGGPGGCIYDRSGEHTRAVGSNEDRRFRGVGRVGWYFQEVKGGHTRDHLIFAGVHLDRQNVSRLLNGATVYISGCTKAHYSDAGRADFDRQVFREGLDRSKRTANRGCSWYMTPRRATR